MYQLDQLNIFQNETEFFQFKTDEDGPRLDRMVMFEQKHRL